ncbi:hypothetical protein ACFWG6_23275 [Streptomyces erythrochromogenes]|uniref:hypothetical protein n=1 Tax=Streptomyces erythrochromogenes TaxID=285574 RepID=UPI0036311025
MTGRLGGLPDLPLDMPWPEGEGNGPPSHIASGLALPASGTLLFFLFDGRLDDEDCMVHPSDPETRPGSRVPHVPAGTRPPPNSRLSVPTSDAPDVRAAFGEADLAAGRFEEAMFTWQCC